MSGSWGVPEPIRALNRVRLAESGEPLVDLRVQMPDLRMLRATAVPWARVAAASMLNRARAALRPSYDIGLREAWRSLARQRFVYDYYFGLLRAEHPEWGHPTLRRQTNRFLAPYDQKAPPGHTTGGAVDVWLLDSDGEALDLSGGSRFAFASTFSRGLKPAVRKLRGILFDAMQAVGFSNCRDEWWHYSYGDAGWAVRTGRDTCFYGYVEPPRAEYEAMDEEFIRTFEWKR